MHKLAKLLGACVASTLLIRAAAVPENHAVVQNRVDNGGTNWNPSETSFTTANVAASGGTLGQLWRTSLDGGYIFAEILYVPGLAFASGTQDAVFVATNLNHVYALNAGTGVWPSSTQRSRIILTPRTTNGL